jgi:ferredoxin--NADP+ reductase
VGSEMCIRDSAQQALRGVAAGRKKAPSARASAPLAGSSALPMAGLVAGCAAVTAVTARRAAATKKKGVKVVHGKEIPWNLFMPKSPYKGKCVSNEVITTKTPLVNWETTHTVFAHDKNVPYIEGQSIGIIAPGPDKKGETPAKIRLYSIASSSPGDDETYNTVSLCVKRVVEVEGRGWCDYSNSVPDKEYPDAKKVYRGVCSSHICDMKAGQDVLITGPTGAEMLLPDDQESNIIMLATGTGIAPFRSFLMKLFKDKGTKGQFKGLAWLFLGVPFKNSILYDEENKKMAAEYPGQFRYDYAVSDEMKNKEGKPMWVQHRAMEYAESLWKLMKNPKTHVYMCGLKGMESGLEECLSSYAAKDGLVWKEYVKSLKKADRYHVEVY